jgi:hypothetical protein
MQPFVNAAWLADEKPCRTLQPTALVHAAYLRLVGEGEGQHWNGRGHFFAADAEAMRGILIESALRKKRGKHGDRWHQVALAEDALDRPSHLGQTSRGG